MENANTAEAVKTTGEVIGYKGFNQDLTCRDFQYEIGKTYQHEGEVKHCKSGFHACENPLNIFDYYAPASSRFAIVKMGGSVSREIDGDTKISSASITIETEIAIPVIVSKAIEWITSLCKPSDAERSTGDQSASSSTGYRSASSSTGDQSASSSTGDQSASSSTGDQSASSSTGDRSASSSTGYQSASSSTGDQSASSSTGYRSASSSTGDLSASSSTGCQSASSSTGYQSASSSTGDLSASSSTGCQSASSSTGYQSASSSTGKSAVALNSGYEGKAKADEFGAIVVCSHDDRGNLLHIRASKVGENGIRPNVFYSLGRDGEFFEVE